jgi:hypothetical protein
MQGGDDRRKAVSVSEPARRSEVNRCHMSKLLIHYPLGGSIARASEALTSNLLAISTA